MSPLDSRFLPDNITEKIADPVEKKRLGKTALEKLATNDRKAERQLQGEVVNFCQNKKLEVGWSNPTRKSTYTKGWPDLTIVGWGKVLFLELKVGTNVLSDDQLYRVGKLEAAGANVQVVYDYKSALKAIVDYFELPPINNL
jgi:hypothetical protein